MVGSKGNSAHPPPGLERPSPTVLIIDGNPRSSAAAARTIGAPGREVLVASSAAAAEKILAAREIALVILDFVLPDADGPALLARIRKTPRTSAVPVIVISSPKDSPLKSECLALGASDWLSRPPDPKALSASVEAILRRPVGQGRDGRHDPLTGLLNRAAFAEAFREATSLAARSRLPLSLAVLDVVRFMEVNGVRDLAAGDKVLQRVAATLRPALRALDVAARWGGSEFVVLFPDTRPEGAAQAMEKVRQTLQGELLPGAGGVPLGVALRTGVAEVSPGDDLDSALMLATQALHRAKVGRRDGGRSPAASASARKVRILLAEDDPAVAVLIKHRLSHEGFEIVHYADGAEAFDAAADAKASLVILDVKMPGMDGFEVLTRLRALPAFARMPIVMLTGMGNEDDIIRGFSLGADDYVLKPFSPHELVARIRRLLLRTQERD